MSKSQIVIIGAICAFIGIANAGNLNPSRNAGSQCYPTDNTSMTVRSCSGSAFPTYMTSASCPDQYSTSVANSTGCKILDNVACGTSTSSCVVCFADTGYAKVGGTVTGSWTSAGSNRVSRVITTISVTSDTSTVCTATATDTTEYGCASGYYTTGSRGSSMTCTICPANATCGSTGNAEVFKCNDGYYRNGSATTCTQCPSSGGITAKTGKTGATAITECYIPSGSSFSDSKGSGTYTDNCYYTN